MRRGGRSRRRIRYFRRFRLQLTSSEQLRLLLEELRSAFQGHPDIVEDTVNIRFEDIQQGNIILRLDAGVNTTVYAVFLGVAEDLNLKVIEAALHCGVVFSGPGELQMAETDPLDAEQIARIEATLQQWRQEDTLPGSPE